MYQFLFKRAHYRVGARSRDLSVNRNAGAFRQELITQHTRTHIEQSADRQNVLGDEGARTCMDPPPRASQRPCLGSFTFGARKAQSDDQTRLGVAKLQFCVVQDSNGSYETEPQAIARGVA